MADRHEFDAVAHVLRAPAFNGAMEQHINDSRRDVAWEAIFNGGQSWSDGERVLLDLAFELWTGRPTGKNAARFADLWRYLDDTNFDRAIDALMIRRGHVQVMS